MLQEEKIQFRKVRNMGETIAAATAFVRQNGSILFKSILYIAMPFILLAVGAYITMFYWVFADSSTFDSAFDELGTYTGLSSLFSLLAMLGSVMLIAVVHEFMFLYIRRSDFNQISVAEVRKKAFDNFGLYLGTTFLLIIAFTIVFFVVIMVMAIFMGSFVFMADQSDFSEGMVVFFILAFIALSVLATYPFIALSFTYVVRAVEGKGFAGALGRCFELTSNNWFATFWLYVVTVFITASVIGLIPVLFTGAVGLVVYLFSWEQVGIILFSFAYILYLIMGMVVNIMALIVVTFRYFSLVELKEGIGLKRKILLIGADTTVQ
ncbi:MAG TPA: hypothetical protein PK239_03045 [Chitinophagales bacterium]|nr:hypothetical protein [Chitinophagales bacterium]HRK26246.1 hypothetical protein [Chitinophagales bacterium]